MINIGLYRFPKDKVKRKQWIQKIHREKWSPKKDTVICSDHFKESCIYRGGNVVGINQDAVPTRFKMFPDHLKKACILLLKIIKKVGCTRAHCSSIGKWTSLPQVGGIGQTDRI